MNLVNIVYILVGIIGAFFVKFSFSNNSCLCLFNFINYPISRPHATVNTSLSSVSNDNIRSPSMTSIEAVIELICYLGT